MARTKTFKSLQEFVDSTPNLVEYFYNDTESPHDWNGPSRFRTPPAPAEWTNWRDEQRAWRETAVLFDQSHHMPELFLGGADALRLLTKVGINSFAGFAPGKAKQLVACNSHGQVIGECVVYCHGADDFELISGMYVQNWVHYLAVSGGYNVTVERDLTTAENPAGRTKFRFGMDGPNAEKIFQEAVEGGTQDIPFFNHIRVRIAGCDVLALRHGMAGHKGVELSGCFADGPKVRSALLSMGEKHGLRAGGTTAYHSACAEGGWMAYPTPAIYTSPDMSDYREWLAGNSWETKLQIGGSFRSENIEGYYVTPWDLGYDRIVKFDHDFIGRSALEKTAVAPRRTAVSLVWNHDDVTGILRSNYESGLPCRNITYPIASYSLQQNDVVATLEGKPVGIAAFSGYSVNEREMISLAMVDRVHAATGNQLVLTWGEPDGGSRKFQVERHRQALIRVTVAPKPYARTVQQSRSATMRVQRP